MPLNQSSQLSLWSFHYPWYFYIKHCHKADPKTIIWRSLDGGEKLQSTVWCIVFAQKKGYVDFLQTASAGDSYGMWLAEESCWFSSFSFSQSLIRGLCLRGKCYLKPLSIKTRSAIRGKHPAKRELGSTNKKKNCLKALIVSQLFTCG